MSFPNTWLVSTSIPMRLGSGLRSLSEGSLLAIETHAEAYEIACRLLDNIETVVHGKREQITLVAAALVCGGHVLLEDVPGTAKTVLARAIARVIDGRCVLPDPVHARPAADRRDRPLDLRPAHRDFEFRPGPLFANVLLVDEINRATPKTQSALARGDGGAAGHRRRGHAPARRAVPRRSRPQNPIEYEGTFPLPEAQLDRFFLRTTLGYPGRGGRSSRSSDEQLDGHPLDTARAGLDARRARGAARAAAGRVRRTTAVGAGSSTSSARHVSSNSRDRQLRARLARARRAARAWALLRRPRT